MDLRAKVQGLKMHELMRLLESTERMDGCAAEFGVAHGGTLQRMARAFPSRMFYGFDTFTGLPAEKRREGESAAGIFGVDDAEFRAMKLAMPANVTLVRGLFPDSADGFDPDLRFCFVHLDFDYYQSTMDVLHWLRFRMVPDGIIVFDDWMKEGCMGVTEAVKELGLEVTETTRTQCYWRNDGRW